ncbi:MAG: hypothetical protein LBG95_00715 [Treponema sp.]|nr:hypothetical protein [Treponema sp.]
MRKISGDEGCRGKNAVLRHGVFAATGPRMLIFDYASFHVFVVPGYCPYASNFGKIRLPQNFSFWDGYLRLAWHKTNRVLGQAQMTVSKDVRPGHISYVFAARHILNKSW